MNTHTSLRHAVFVFLVAMLALSSAALRAQTAPSPSPSDAGAPNPSPTPSVTPVGSATPAPTEETITLSPFDVTGAVMGRYEAVDATSGGRVRLPLMDAPQSTSVITHQVIEDVGATRILDAAKYSAGISESTIPNAQDRTNLRGFQQDGATIDGFNFFSYSNVDPVVIDRLEIIKGPDAILSPGIAAGTVNVISKKPSFSGNNGSVDFQVGSYDADRAEFDYNRVIANGKVAIRVVGAAEHAHDQAAGNFNDSQIIMPMVSFRLGANTQITAQFQAYNYYGASYGGLPIDFSVGTNTPAFTIAGLPSDTDYYTPEIARHSEGEHHRLFIESSPIENFSARLALNYIHWTGDSVAQNMGNIVNPTTGVQTLENGAGGYVQQNPANGNWVWTGAYPVNGSLFNTQSPGVAYPSGSVSYQTRQYLNLQNDYVYTWKFGNNKSTTLAGFMVDYNSNPSWAFPINKPNLPIWGFTQVPYQVSPVVNADSYSISWDDQFYASEQLSLLSDHLLLTGGLGRSEYKNYSHNIYAGTAAQNIVSANLPSATIEVKLIPQLALFADQSQQAQPNGSAPAGYANPVTTGKQREVGLRAQLLDKRVYITVTDYKITQNNYSIPNQANNVIPPPNPLLPPLFTDRIATGLEVEVTAAITDQLSLIGNYSYIHDRTPLGQVFRGDAPDTADVLVNYAFAKKGELKGLSLGVGIDYMSKRPGDNPSPGGYLNGYNGPIGQPTFYLPKRTLTQVMMNYRFTENWKFQFSIDNLFNVTYLAASTGRNSVFPGTPFNPRTTVTYSF